MFRQVVRSIKPGTKREPYELYPFTRYFGHPRSSNQLVVYDKSLQLWKKKEINVPDGRVRVESRLKPAQLYDLPSTVDELAKYDWSMLLPRYFSFHLPRSNFMVRVNMAGDSWRRPIWRLRDLAVDLHGITPSNFYRDCLMDHPQFTRHVSKSLANFRWA